MERQENGGLLLFELIFCMVISVLLSRLSVGILVFPVPLLLVSSRVKETWKAVLAFVVADLAVLLWLFLPYVGYLSPLTAGIVAFSLVFAFISCLVSTLYTGLREFSSSMLRKLVICSIPAAAAGAGFALWLSGAQEAQEGMKLAYTSYLPQTLGGVDIAAVIDTVIQVMIMGAVPISLAIAAFPVFVAELGIHRFDSDWQRDFADMKMPDSYVWVFFVLLASAAASLLVKNCPQWVRILSFNLAAGMSLHYMLGGMSALLALIRRRSEFFPASRLFWLVVVSMIVPGVNIAVMAGLAVLGVLETWVKIRK